MTHSVLRRMGFPLDKLGARVDIVTELHRLSEGDPLLVRLYVDDLWARGEEAAWLQPEDLQQVRPGLEGYFERWWQDQCTLWGDRAPLRERAVRALLNLLACALGPLTQDDVLRLAPDDAGMDTWILEEALKPLDRFAIGDGREQGYILGHPRLGAYFYERLTPAERGEWEQHFLGWGEKVLAALNEGALVPREAPAYLVQYYGAHLERAGTLPGVLLMLVSDGWRRACEALEGAFAGFLSDVERAWRAAEGADAKTTADGSLAPYLGGQVRCALCQASVNSLAASIQPELLVLLVENEIWTPVQGLTYARQVPESRQQSDTLSGLAPHLPETLMGDALAAALEIKDEVRQVEVLSGLVPHLPERLLGEALAAAREIENEGVRVYALKELALYLPKRLLGEALAAAREIESESSRAAVLLGLAPYLQEALRGQVAEEALVAAREIADEWWRAKVLSGLVPHLPETLREQVVEEALAAVQEIESEGMRAEALSELASCLLETLLGEALATAREIESETSRAEALSGLVLHLPEMLRGQVVAEALAAAREIEIEWSRAEVLSVLAPHLPETLWGKALVAAQEIESEWSRVKALSGLAPHLAETLWGEALAAAREIEYEWNRAEALAELAPHLPERLLGEALAEAREIEDEGSRAQTFSGLALYLPEASRKQVAEEALATVPKIWDADDRARVLILAKLATRMGETEQARDIRALIREAEDEAQIAGDLALRLAQLGDPEGALAAARQYEDENKRTQALSALTTHLTTLSRPELTRIWLQEQEGGNLLHFLARRTRKDLLVDLQVLAPVIAALGGREAVPETFRAIQDVGEWWP
ncbi:MAG: hypothetical protein GY835_19730 [bacterium]|nr:hypothetical protein [bacterium]